MSDTHKELRQSIVSAFRKFSMDPHNSPLKKQKDREIAGRFIDRVHSTSFDLGSLPYHSANGKAKGHSKAECVFAMMCDIVLNYWYLVQSSLAISGHVADTITNKLILLDRVYKEYDQLVILGDVKGYYLIGKGNADVSKKSKPKGKKVSKEKTDEGINGTTAEVEEQVTMQDKFAEDLDDGYGTVGGGPAPLD